MQIFCDVEIPLRGWDLCSDPTLISSGVLQIVLCSPGTSQLSSSSFSSVTFTRSSDREASQNFIFSVVNFLSFHRYSILLFQPTIKILKFAFHLYLHPATNILHNIKLPGWLSHKFIEGAVLILGANCRRIRGVDCIRQALIIAELFKTCTGQRFYFKHTQTLLCSYFDQLSTSADRNYTQHVLSGLFPHERFSPFFFFLVQKIIFIHCSDL